MHDIPYLKKFKFVKREQTKKVKEEDNSWKQKKKAGRQSRGKKEEEKQKIVVKGNSAVDPESGLADSTHILTGNQHSSVSNIEQM